MFGIHGRDRRAARDLLGAGRSDRPLNERVDTLEILMEYVMADLDTLNSTLDAIAADAAEVATEHQTLVEELTQLQEQIANNQPVDLSGVIAKATSIKSTLDGIVDAASGATSAPASLTVSPASLSGTAGQALTGSLSVSGGTAPYTYSSSLADVAVDANGAVSGTPAAAETGAITVTDSSSPALTASVPVTIS